MNAYLEDDRVFSFQVNIIQEIKKWENRPVLMPLQTSEFHILCFVNLACNLTSKFQKGILWQELKQKKWKRTVLQQGQFLRMVCQGFLGLRYGAEVANPVVTQRCSCAFHSRVWTVFWIHLLGLVNYLRTQGHLGRCVY